MLFDGGFDTNFFKIVFVGFFRSPDKSFKRIDKNLLGKVH